MADPRLVVVLARCSDLRVEVDPLTGAISRDARTVALSASDAAAIEHGLRLASAWGARTLVLTAGGPECDGPLREVAALGAEVRRVATKGSYVEELAADERALSKALVGAMGDHPDLVLCADRSADRGTGALPAFVVHDRQTSLSTTMWARSATRNSTVSMRSSKAIPS